MNTYNLKNEFFFFRRVYLFRVGSRKLEFIGFFLIL